MKFTLLSNYSLEDYYDLGYSKTWNTPKTLYTAFKSIPGIEIRWIPLFVGEENFGFKEARRQHKRGEYVPDGIIVMNYGNYDNSFWKKDYFPGSKLIFEAADEPQQSHWYLEKASNSHLVLTPDYTCYLKYKNEHKINAMWTAHWADKNTWYKSNFDNYTPFSVVTTMGCRGEVSDWLPTQLGDKFLNPRTTGYNMSGEENANFYRNGKIVFQKSTYDEVTRRIFEGMACGKLVITDRISKEKRLEDLFKENEEIVLYDTKEEALEKINFYLNNEAERERIALNGYRKTTNYYMADNIAKRIISYMESGKDSYEFWL
jgi:hypothetical protein